MSNVLKKELINWYTWSNETIEKAKAENKSIFLFVNSHAQWAKKMQEESFCNPSVIELLNERFIPIMIQKNERPDIERYYQKIYTLMNRQMAGSPLSIFLTANLEPFYAGAYVPSQDINEQLSLESLLRIISKKYITDYDTLAKKGQEVLSFIDKQEQSIQATKLSLSISNTISQHTNTLLDKEFGGFSKETKFPNTSTLELLFDLYQLKKEPEILNALTLSLDNMAKGGFYDQENGGFYHYSKNKAWTEPYEVKTTYDNAQLIQLYLRAYRVTQNENYKTVAFKSLDFMINSQQNSKLFALEDEPIVTSWNALMVQALFTASNIDAKYKVSALESLEALLSELYVAGTLYHFKKTHKKSNDKRPQTKAFLEDYATLGETLIIAYQNSLDESFLIMATQFANLIVEQYYEQARWVYSTGTFKLRENTHDKDLPSAISSSLSLLLSIASLVENNYKKFVFKTLELHSFELMRQPLSSPKLSQMVLRYLKDDIIIQANEETLKKHINERGKMSYPYVYFKSVLEDEFNIHNSHSLLRSERTFKKVKQYIKAL